MPNGSAAGHEAALDKGGSGVVPDTALRRALFWIWDKGSATVGFILLVVYLSVSTDTFFTADNLLNVGRQVAAIGVLSIGMTFVIVTRNIDLSAGSSIALLGVLLASLVEDYGLSVWIAIPLIMVAGGILYAAMGAIVAYQRIPSFIVTAAMLTALRGLAFLYSNRPIFVSDPALRNLGRGFIGPLPIALVIMAVAYVLGHVLLHHTRFGNHVFAVGDNPEAARLLSIKNERVVVLAFVLMGLCAALSATIITGRLSSGSPNAGSLMELDAIAAVVLGGTSLFGGVGSMSGTLIGVLVMGILSNGMNLLGVSSYNQMVVRGFVILVAVWLNHLKMSRAR